MASNWQGFKQRRLCSALQRRHIIKTLQHTPNINVRQQFRVSMKYANAMASYQVQLVQRRCTIETEGMTSYHKKPVDLFKKKKIYIYINKTLRYTKFVWRNCQKA